MHAVVVSTLIYMFIVVLEHIFVEKKQRFLKVLKVKKDNLV
jgi:uncharacterized membrane protein